MSDFNRAYLEELKKRAKESRIYRPHQLIGLQIAELLGDYAHKSLYIKLAKEYNHQILLGLAKQISQSQNIKNRGAYFMNAWTKIRPAGLKFKQTKTNARNRKNKR